MFSVSIHFYLIFSSLFSFPLLSFSFLFFSFLYHFFFVVCAGRETPLDLKLSGLGVGPLVQLDYDTVDTGDVLVRNHYEYQFIMQNCGEIDAHFSLVPSPSVSVEEAMKVIGRTRRPPQFDVMGKVVRKRKGSKNGQERERRGRSGSEKSTKDTDEYLINPGTPQSSNSLSPTRFRSSDDSHNTSPNPLHCCNSSEREDLSSNDESTSPASTSPNPFKEQPLPPSLALIPPVEGTSALTHRLTRPPIVFTPDNGLTPPHKQMAVKVSFYAERVGKVRFKRECGCVGGLICLFVCLFCDGIVLIEFWCMVYTGLPIMFN